MTQDTLPHFKFLNLFTSAKFLLPCQTAYSQGPGMREVDTLGAISPLTTGIMGASRKEVFLKAAAARASAFARGGGWQGQGGVDRCEKRDSASKAQRQKGKSF